MSDIELPVAFCETCGEDSPVVVKEVALVDYGYGNNGSMTLIYCPGCQNLLNLQGDVEVRWYKPEELEKATGWRYTP